MVVGSSPTNPILSRPNNHIRHLFNSQRKWRLVSQSIYKHRPITYSQRKGPYCLIWAVSQLILSYSDFSKMAKTLAFSRMLKCFAVKKNTFDPILSLMNHQNQPSRDRIWAAQTHGSLVSNGAEISIPLMFSLG